MNKSSLAPVADAFTFGCFFVGFVLYIDKLQEAKMKLGGPCVCYIVNLNVVLLSVSVGKIVRI